MAEVEAPVAAASPPPNCAICLGPCADKCFSDSCMHQFCFTCLLEWSKIKPVCPLCKQPFKSIIHNVKSNEEYDQHVVERQDVTPNQNLFEDNDFVDLYLPPAPSRHFQFRTTFTVDPRGELAIQQMLLTHPLTNSVFIPGYNIPRYNNNRYGRRRDISSTAYRRSIYHMNLWAVMPQPEITGRYRETSPEFFSENPAARNRLVPWLNRELNALLSENTQQVMHLVDVILTHLTSHDIKGVFFRSMLNEYLVSKTDHFIHEFYCFMRSPYDMIGYDRHVTYAPRVQPPIEVISDHDSDSDVAIVSVSTYTSTSTEQNPFVRPTLEVIEINSSDGESVILVDSESRETPATVEEEVVENNISAAENRKPILPLKIRLKHKRQSRESREKKSRLKRKYRSSSSSSSSESSDSPVRSRKIRRKSKKLKKRYKKSKRNLESYIDCSSSSDDEPLLYRQRKKETTEGDLKIKKRRKSSKKDRYERVETVTSASSNTNQDEEQSSNEAQQIGNIQEYYRPTMSYYGNDAIDRAEPWNFEEPIKEEIVTDVPTQEAPGPSSSSGRLRSVIVKKEHSKDLWFSRPCIRTDSSDED